MNAISLVSDIELLSLMPKLVLAERACSADVIEHLVEIDRRRLFLDQACGSLSAYCVERLGYSADEAGKRVRVARLASRFPEALAELRSGAIHLTGLFLLAKHVTGDNGVELLSAARGLSRTGIERLLAERFPKPDVPDQMNRLAEQTSAAVLTCPGALEASPAPATCSRTDPVSALAGRLEPLAASRWLVQFTASAELHEKIVEARELLSHALPSGDLAALFERAIDALIERETKRRFGAAKPTKRRLLSPNSRHIPVDVVRLVWERDGGQCTFVDEDGRRCSARRFLEVEHRHPFALGGQPTAENLCLLCRAHNAHAARKVFGHANIDRKINSRRARQNPSSPIDERTDKVHRALCQMGFRDRQARRALAELARTGLPPELQGLAEAKPIETLLRAALGVLGPR